MDDFITKNNTELSNVLGNFVNRTLTFAQKYFEGKVPPAGNREDLDKTQLLAISEQAKKVTENLEAFHFKDALHELMQLARAGNVYFDAKQPWKQRKDDLPACGTTINVCIQTVRALTTLMAPFLPFIRGAMPPDASTRPDRPPLPGRAQLQELPAGHTLGEPAILFKKLDPAEVFSNP